MKPLYRGGALAHQVLAPKSKGLLTIERDDGFATTAVTPEPIPCAGCAQMRAVFVNRNGSSLCSTCDATRLAA